MINMKKYLFICLLGTFFNCTNQQKSVVVDSKKSVKEDIIEVKDSLLFNKVGKIIGASHFENNVREGFSLIFDEKTHNPKYLVEYNEGKRDRVIIAFNNDGKIKSFRSADIYHDGQTMDFHENGVIKEIGNTVKGRADGTCYYFNKEGELIRKVLYEKGKILSE